MPMLRVFASRWSTSSRRTPARGQTGRRPPTTTPWSSSTMRSSTRRTRTYVWRSGEGPDKQIFSNYSLQTEEEPPPSYSPTLKEGEEACTSTSSYPPRARSSAGGQGAALQPAAYSPTSHSNLPSSPPPYSWNTLILRNVNIDCKEIDL